MTLPQTIKKRDGSTEAFNKKKIEQAIQQAQLASKETNQELAKQTTQTVTQQLPTTPTVEQVQDRVEEELMRQAPKTAKKYILYRHQKTQLREAPDTIANLKAINDYLQLDDWEVNENANMTYSLQGLNNHIASKLSKQYWLAKIYSPEISNAHRTGDIHVHDLGQLSVYCVGWDLEDLLRQGFTGVPGKISSAPAKHFKTALMQAVNFFYTLQGESAGAQAFSSLDTLLAPFISYDKLTEKEVRQAIQEFVFNLNVPTRVGFQAPFTNITLDLKVPPHYKDQAVIIGGEEQTTTYKEHQQEIDLFNKVLAEVLAEGDAQGRVFTFPIPTYNITKDFEWNNPAYEPIWEMTAKYGIPYFANFVNSDMNPEDARSMCCRLRLDNRELRKRGGGLFGANPLTGSIGVVTINLPRIGYTSSSEEELKQQLHRLLLLAKQSLETKRQVLEKLTEQGLYPYSKHYLQTVKQATGKYWTNHFSTIGIIGMNELLTNYNNTSLVDKQGHALATRLMDYVREVMIQFQEETNNNYNLEATPGEGTTYRLAKLDQERHPGIQSANEQGEPFYTNSTHLHVHAQDDLFKHLSLQDPLQTKYTGGTVFHTFLGEDQLRSDTVKALVKKIAHTFELPYYTLTPTFSICQEHGRVAGEHHTCPQCKQPCEVYSRVVGYLRPVDQWNKGKQAEFTLRDTFEKTAKQEVL